MAEKEIQINDLPLSSLRVVDLKSELDKRGLSKSGTKKDLQERLKAQLLLEDTLKEPVTEDSEDKTPNHSLQNVEGQNDFVKEYLANQQKNFQLQMEAKRLALQANESASSQDESYTEDKEGRAGAVQETEEKPLIKTKIKLKRTKNKTYTLKDTEPEVASGENIVAPPEIPESEPTTKRRSSRRNKYESTTTDSPTKAPQEEAINSVDAPPAPVLPISIEPIEQLSAQDIAVIQEIHDQVVQKEIIPSPELSKTESSLESKISTPKEFKYVLSPSQDSGAHSLVLKRVKSRKGTTPDTTPAEIVKAASESPSEEASQIIEEQIKPDIEMKSEAELDTKEEVPSTKEESTSVEAEAMEVDSPKKEEPTQLESDTKITINDSSSDSSTDKADSSSESNLPKKVEPASDSMVTDESNESLPITEVSEKEMETSERNSSNSNKESSSKKSLEEEQTSEAIVVTEESNESLPISERPKKERKTKKRKSSGSKKESLEESQTSQKQIEEAASSKEETLDTPMGEDNEKAEQNDSNIEASSNNEAETKPVHEKKRKASTKDSCSDDDDSSLNKMKASKRQKFKSGDSSDNTEGSSDTAEPTIENKMGELATASKVESEDDNQREGKSDENEGNANKMEEDDYKRDEVSNVTGEESHIESGTEESTKVTKMDFDVEVANISEESKDVTEANSETKIINEPKAPKDDKPYVPKIEVINKPNPNTKPVKLKRFSESTASNHDPDSSADANQLNSQSSNQSKEPLSANGESETRSKRRKWGSKKVLNNSTEESRVVISTDSLKDLIPETKQIEVKSPAFEPEPPKISKPVQVQLPPKSPTVAVEKIKNEANQAPEVVPKSPPHNPCSAVLHVRNLVRPFTLPQLKDMLNKFGEIADNGFWIDKIKSNCFVMYKNEADAEKARTSLHKDRWPSSNPKTLVVDYSSQEELERQLKDPSRPIENRPPPISPQLKKPAEEVRPPPAPVREKKVLPIREWDLGKVPLESPERKRPSPERESHSKSKRDKKEDPKETQLLDDLFRKTKHSPCIYWLPLTEEQVAKKEEERKQSEADRLKRRQNDEARNLKQKEDRQARDKGRSRTPIGKRHY